MIHRLVAGLVLFAGLSACSLLPSAAPTALEFTGPAPKDSDYALVNLDVQIARVLADYHKAGLAAAFAGSYQPSLVLRNGDTISTTVYEVTPVPLFGSSITLESGSQNLPVGGHTSTIPIQVVGLDGTVPVPFGGKVKIAGLTTDEAGKAVAKALEGKATNPQAVVTLINSVTNAATVNGDVGKPGAVPLTIRGERVLDVIALAGGAKYPSYDSDLQLIRAGRVARINLQQVVDEPRENVTIKPGDSLYVIHNPRSFTVLGSASKVDLYDFNTEQVTLAEAVARAGGLNEETANVGDIYLMRFEAPETIERLRKIGHRPELESAQAGPSGLIPVAYHLDLRQAAGYFVSQSVQIRDKDVVLVTNAGSVQLSKLLALMRGLSGIYYDIHTAFGGVGNTTKISLTTTRN